TGVENVVRVVRLPDSLRQRIRHDTRRHTAPEIGGELLEDHGARPFAVGGKLRGRSGVAIIAGRGSNEYTHYTAPRVDAGVDPRNIVTKNSRRRRCEPLRETGDSHRGVCAGVDGAQRRPDLVLHFPWSGQLTESAHLSVDDRVAAAETEEGDRILPDAEGARD